MQYHAILYAEYAEYAEYADYEEYAEYAKYVSFTHHMMVVGRSLMKPQPSLMQNKTKYNQRYKNIQASNSYDEW